MTEKIYEVYWKGPFKPESLSNLTDQEIEKLCLYSVYGSHPLYGDNVLLYIGITERGANTRLKEHDYWMDLELYTDSRIYLASIGEFVGWDKSEEIEIFDKPDRVIIEQIESLLIYAHQPCHNSRNTKTAASTHGIRIFNTGRSGRLFPEVSALYEAIESTSQVK